MEEKNVLTALREALPGGVLETGESFGDPLVADNPVVADDPVVRIQPEALLSAAGFLKAEPWSYTMLLDATCVDYPDRPGRFEMIYHFFSLARNRRIRIKAALPSEHPEIGSLSGLWKNADWLEREIFDMFGVRFSGHPDLRRLFMYDGFEGHPLRKDYPLRKRQPLFNKREAS